VTVNIAVSSCKGGVGKSTVAVNLAYSLAQSGAKVGLFDADVYGPSLPTMVRLEDPVPEMFGQKILPLEHKGVKLMSFGFVMNDGGASGPAIMRGPMVTQVVTQLLNQTEWGDLDYLVIDLPPGTGDIQITLAQVISLTAAIIVTTPQKISFIDVVKGIEMFDKLKIPTIGVVENMSYFLCDQCDKKHYPYGKGALRSLIEQYGFKHAFELPLDPSVSPSGDLGEPFILADPDSELSRQFRGMTEAWVGEITAMQALNEKPLTLVMQDDILVLKKGEDTVSRLNPRELRLQCRCAHCVDEFSGKPRLDPKTVSEGIQALTVSQVGNYAAAVNWNDGHASLFPLERLNASN